MSNTRKHHGGGDKRGGGKRSGKEEADDAEDAEDEQEPESVDDDDLVIDDITATIQGPVPNPHSSQPQSQQQGTMMIDALIETTVTVPIYHVDLQPVQDEAENGPDEDEDEEKKRELDVDEEHGAFPALSSRIAVALRAVNVLEPRFQREINEATELEDIFRTDQAGHVLVEHDNIEDTVAVDAVENGPFWATGLPRQLYDPDQPVTMIKDEVFDRERVVHLLKNWASACVLIRDKDPDTNFQFDAAKQKLLWLIKKAKYGVLSDVTYRRKGGFGRFYAESRLSLSKMKGCIRDTAIAHITWDGDMKNCHFSILPSVKTLCGLSSSTTLIDMYVRDTDKYRKEVAEALRVEVAEAKQRIIKILYGSKNTSNQCFLKDLAQEVNDLKNDLWDTYPNVLKRYRPAHEETFQTRLAVWTQYGQGKWKRPEYKPAEESCFALILQNFETNIMCVTIDFVKEQYPKLGNTLLYMYDGAAWLRPDNVSKEQFQQTLNMAAQKVLQELGARVTFEIKPAKKDLLAKPVPREPSV